MKIRLLVSGFVLWLLATVLLRVRGEHLISPGSTVRIAILFLLAFPAMAFLARWVCRRLPPQERLPGAVSFAMPTLLLDPFSSAFFPSVFPNMDPNAAGIFGGLMLWCCAGAFTGVLIRK
jgi:hypothetical protein